LPSENKEGVLICNLIKTSPHFDLHSKSSPPAIFHLAQAAPTRYRDRSHWPLSLTTSKIRPLSL